MTLKALDRTDIVLLKRPLFNSPQSVVGEKAVVKRKAGRSGLIGLHISMWGVKQDVVPVKHSETFLSPSQSLGNRLLYGAGVWLVRVPLAPHTTNQSLFHPEPENSVLPLPTRSSGSGMPEADGSKLEQLENV